MNGRMEAKVRTGGFDHISQTLCEVMKEIGHRRELRARLQAEWGRPLEDDEFIPIAECTGKLRI
jgi:hypothetical protein